MMNKNLPIPKNEVARLAALAQYNILDTLPEEEFDRLTQLASIICGVPIALITLIDMDRQWFKSKIGLDATEMPRDIYFCQYIINGESLLEIEDATKDERFLSNPLVTGQPNIRFYAGYPLIDPDGYALGSLCVIDRVARKLTADQRRALTLLANEVVSQIVSRKKNAERDRLEKMFDLSNELKCIVGSDGYLKKLNPGYTLALGWTIEELLAKPFYDFIHPDDVTITTNEIKKVATGEKTINFENRLVKKNGDYLSISWNANPDEITGELYAVGRDLTERRKVEKSLEESISNMEAILESTADGILVVDHVGNIVRFNKKFQELWSIPEEVMLTMDDNIALDSVLYQLENPQNFLAKVKELYENPEAISSDIIELKDGRVFARYSQPNVMNGVNRGRVWSYRNITERINTEKEKQQLFALIETSEDFIAFGDLKGNPTFMNKAARKHLGIGDKKMLSNLNGDNFFDLKEIKYIKEVISEGLKKEGKWEGETHLLNIKTKKKIPVQMSAFVIRDYITGKAIGLGNVSKDITERKKIDLILSDEKIVMEMIATEKPVSEILEAIALNYESYFENAICSISLLNEEGTHIEHIYSPSLPDAFNKWIDGIPIRPVAGSCGTAIYRKERVIVSDIANDPLWVNYRDFALSFGLKACWSTPIIGTQGKVYGTFAVYYKEHRTPVEAEFKLIDLIIIDILIALERYNKNVEIKESEEKYRNLFEQAAEGIFLFDKNGNILSVNTSGCVLLGYAKKHLLKMNLKDVMPVEFMGEAIVDLVSVQKGKSIFIEKQFRRKNGDVIDTGVSVRLLSDGNIQTIIRDITKSKKEDLLRKVIQEKYQNIIANMNLGLLEVDNNDIIQYANQSFADISGYEISELLGKTPKELFIFVENIDVIIAKTQFREQGKSDAYQIKIKNKKGELRWWTISRAPNYDDEGNLLGSIGIHLDITDQKQLEIDLENEKTKAEEASKAKESFLANMSHEIRTPLNAIIGFLRELEKQELSGLQKTYIKNSSIASSHLSAILNTILDLSKIEAGEMSLEEEDFLFEDSLNNVLNVLNLKAEQKKIRLTALISDTVNKVFKGDSLRLEQILFNLIGNALKFTHKGKIEVSCELLSDSKTSQIIQISVADTGIGMEQKYAESIFSKFSQEDKSITRKYGGTGLGMVITKELVHLMGGEIEIESEKNIGTTVHVTINLIKGNIEIVKILQQNVDFDLKGLSILLVEDNEMNRMVVQNALQYYNCSVIEAENGLEAVKILKIQNFDLILMDIQMPEMDGIEATKVIRKELKLSTPIIALTANAFKTEIEKCKQAGMNDYVTKPFEEAVLLKAIVKHTINKNGIPSLDNETNLNQPLYNLNVLRDSSRGNDEFVVKMVGVFVEQTIATIEKIDAALESNNFSEISRLIHKIRPSIDNMGVLSIQSEMKTLEKIAKETQNKEQITAIYTLVKKTLQLVISQLQKNE